jgi:two-component system, chemotaxis family, sensor kinase CheA
MTDEFDFTTGLPSNEMAAYLQLYLDETTEQLDELVESLLVLERDPGDTVQLNEAFRLVHSIKGSAAMMGLESVTALTHRLENYFERLRGGWGELDQGTMSLILKCIDFLRKCNARLRSGEPLASASELLEELGKLSEDSVEPPASRSPESRSDTMEVPEVSEETLEAAPSAATADYAPADNAPADNAPADYATADNATAEEFSAVNATTDHAANDNATADNAPPTEVRESSSDAVDTPPVPREEGERPPPGPKVSDTLRVDVERLDSLMNLAGELVINQARFVQLARLMRPNLKKSTLANQARLLGERLRRRFLEVEVSDPTAEARGAGTGEITPSLELEELKADLVALEEQSRVWEETRRHFNQMLEAIDQLARVSRSLQHAVLDTRMVPVGPLFNRFKRVVRDVSTELGKQVDLEIRGENTELDKRMIDELHDPLVHLVRNAIDHGIESSEDRHRSGKPRHGVIRLEAIHRGNNVFITVSDDGRGIAVEAIRNRIVERGLIGSTLAAQLPDEQIIDFIWHPGFSTASSVSNLSGRGVGMDIVKTRITELNGTVSVGHEAERGTTFTIRLPLTLAIIRCLLFRLPHGVFAVPIENVREIVALPMTQIVSVFGNRTFEFRGVFVPLLEIDEIFTWHSSSTESRWESAATTLSQPVHRATPSTLGPRPEGLPASPRATPDRIDIVIMDSGNQSMALRVEELMGVQDIVIKSLSENFVQTRGLAGASILGDGSVCLLLDAAAIIQLALQMRDGSGGTWPAPPT